LLIDQLAEAGNDLLKANFGRLALRVLLIAKDRHCSEQNERLDDPSPPIKQGYDVFWV
jgi:hypothetical protein